MPSRGIPVKMPFTAHIVHMQPISVIIQFVVTSVSDLNETVVMATSVSITTLIPSEELVDSDDDSELLLLLLVLVLLVLVLVLLLSDDELEELLACL